MMRKKLVAILLAAALMMTTALPIYAEALSGEPFAESTVAETLPAAPESEAPAISDGLPESEAPEEDAPAVPSEVPEGGASTGKAPDAPAETSAAETSPASSETPAQLPETDDPDIPADIAAAEEGPETSETLPGGETPESSETLPAGEDPNAPEAPAENAPETPEDNAPESGLYQTPEAPVTETAPALGASAGLTFTYTLDGDNCTITGYTGTMPTALVIPAEIDGHTVTGIGKEAFRNCTGLLTLSLPDTLRSIGEQAFAICINLLSLELPDGLESIGYGAFYACESISGHLVIPDSVTSLGTYAFASCGCINEITFPAGLTAIPEGVCNGYDFLTNHSDRICTSLYTVHLPAGLTSIGPRAFYGSYLSDLSLPDSLITIDRGAFENSPYLGSGDSYSLVIPERVTTIGADAFLGCSGKYFERLHLPASLQSIGANAFYGCSFSHVYYSGTAAQRDALLSALPEGNTRLQSATWHLGPALTAHFDTNGGFISWSCDTKIVTTGEPYGELPPPAQYANSWLQPPLHQDGKEDLFTFAGWWTAREGGEQVTPETLVAATTDHTLYAHWTPKAALEPVTLDHLVVEYSGDSCTITGYDGNPAGDLVIPDSLTKDGVSYSVKRIDTGAFQNKYGLTSVSLPCNVYLERYAFSGCVALASVTFRPDPESPTECYSKYANADYGFENCTSLTEITIPMGAMSMNYIPEGMFMGCTALERVDLSHSGASRIDEQAFKGCTSLVSVLLPNGMSTIQDEAFYNCSALAAIALPNSISGIGDLAFCGTGLTEVVLPAQLRYFGYNSIDQASRASGVFKYCESLRSVRFTNTANAIAIHAHAFDGCTELAEVLFDPGAKISTICTLAFQHCEKLRTLDLSGVAELTSLGETSLALAGITSITLPDSLAAIGIQAFANCTSLRQITIPAGVTAIPKQAFADCTGLTRVVLPEGITAIGVKAFQNCPRLSDIQLPATVNTLDEQAFAGCRSLVSFAIPSGVATIPKSCFSDCISLRELYLPATVTTIQSNAFKNCISLQEIWFDGTPEQLGEIGGSATGNEALGSEDLIFHFPLSITLNANGGAFADGQTTATIAVWPGEAYGALPEPVREGYVFAGWYDGTGSGAVKIEADTPAPEAAVTLYAHWQAGIYELVDGQCTLVGVGGDPASLTIPKIVELDGVEYEVKAIAADALAGKSALTDIYYAGTAEDWAALAKNGNTFAGITVHCAFALALDPTDGAMPEGTPVTVYVIEGRPLGALPIPVRAGYGFTGWYTAASGGERVTADTIASLSITTLYARWAGMLTYASRNGSLAVTGYDAGLLRQSGGVVIIPAAEGGVPVTAVDDRVFANCTDLVQLTLPEGLVSIGEEAFSGCTGLLAVQIPDSVTAIGAGAFMDCQALTAATLPADLAQIPAQLFLNCWYLASVNIPASVTSIGEKAFAGCMRLASPLDLGQTDGPAMTIGDSAFYNCGATPSIVIRNNVTSIGEHAFHCGHLGDCTVTLTLEDGEQPLVIKSYAFASCLITGTLFVPRRITLEGGNLYDHVFDFCQRLEKVVLPDGLYAIPNYTFISCVNLTDVEIPASVKVIGSYAFAYCENLPAITLPDGLRTIYVSAFTGCSSLAAIDLPDSLAADGIWNSAFEDCTALKTVTIPCAFLYNAFIRCSALEEVVIKQGVTNIPSLAFSDCTSLKTVTIPASVTSIYRNAFQYAPLETVYFGGSPQQWQNILYDQYGNRVLRLPDTPVFLAPAPFTAGGLCYAINEDRATVTLTGYEGDPPSGELAIPATANGYIVAAIGEAAFQGCTGLAAVTLPEDLTSIGAGAFAGCTGLAAVNIPDAVTELGEGAFSGCASLAAVNIPNAVTELGEAVFSGCANLASVALPENLISIGSQAFKGCAKLAAVDIPISVRTIGEEAFAGCTGLAAISLPNSVTELGEGAFFGCAGLVSVQLPTMLPALPARLFQNCTGLAQITVPHSVTSIGEEAFAGCTALAAADLSSKLTSLGTGAFKGCENLAAVVLPATLKAIPQEAFAGCAALAAVTIPASVTSIGENAFANCAALAEVFYSGTPAAWNKIAIQNGNEALTGAALSCGVKLPEPTPLPLPTPAPDPDPLPTPTPVPDPLAGCDALALALVQSGAPVEAATAGMAGVTLQVQNAGTETPLPADLFLFVSSDPAVATVEADGAVTFLAAGQVIFTATVKNDPLQRAVSLGYVQVLPANTGDAPVLAVAVQSNPAETPLPGFPTEGLESLARLELDQADCLAWKESNGNKAYSFTLLPTVAGHTCTYTYASTNTGVAAVKGAVKGGISQCTVTIAGAGSCVVTVTAKEGKAVVATWTLPITVRDYTPRASLSAVTLYQALTTPAALTLYAAHGAGITGVAVVTRVKEDGVFVYKPDDRLAAALAATSTPDIAQVELRPGAELTDKNQTISGFLEVTVAGPSGAQPYYLPLKVTVKATASLPAFTAKVAVVNLFMRDEPLFITLAGFGGGVTAEDVESITLAEIENAANGKKAIHCLYGANGEDNTNAAGVLQPDGSWRFEQNTGKFTAGCKTAQVAAQYQVSVKFRGRAEPVSRTVNLQLKYTKPTLRLSASETTLYPTAGADQVTFRPQIKNGKVYEDLAGAQLSSVSVMKGKNNVATLFGLGCGSGKAVLRLVDTRAAAISAANGAVLKLQVICPDWLEPVEVSAKLSVSAKLPTVKLAAPTLAAYTEKGSAALDTALAVTGSYDGTLYCADITLTSAPKNVLDVNYPDVSWNAESERIQVAAPRRVNGTFKYRVVVRLRRPGVADVTVATQTLTVNCKNSGAPTASVSAKGSLDLIDRATGVVTLTVKTGTVTAAIQSARLVELTPVKVGKKTEYEEAATARLALLDGDAPLVAAAGNSATLTLRALEGAAFAKNEKLYYKLELTLADGTRVETPVANTTAKQATVKLKVGSPVTLYMSNGAQGETSLTVTAPATARIQRVIPAFNTAQSSAFLFRYTSDGRLTVSLRDDAQLKPGTYTVKLLAQPFGSAEGGGTTVSVKIVLKK